MSKKAPSEEKQASILNEEKENVQKTKKKSATSTKTEKKKTNRVKRNVTDHEKCVFTFSQLYVFMNLDTVRLSMFSVIARRF